MRPALTMLALWPLLASCAPIAQEPSSDAQGWRVTNGEGFRDLHHGSRHVLRHVTGYDPARHEATFRTYDHVAGFHGAGFITKGEGGKYPHHRGLFMGWNKTRSGGEVWDFWHGTRGASLRHRNYVEDPARGQIVAVTDWTTPEGKPVVTETRAIAANLESEVALVLDYTFILEAAREKVELDGDPQHAGFQFRAAQEVADREKETAYVRPASAIWGKDDLWEGCEWTACRFSVQGYPYAVVHMDHPKNPRPVIYSTRPYGRFGSFFKAVLEPGKPVTLRYRILVLDGTHRDAGFALLLEKRFRAYAEKR